MRPADLGTISVRPREAPHYQPHQALLLLGGGWAFLYLRYAIYLYLVGCLAGWVGVCWLLRVGVRLRVEYAKYTFPDSGKPA